MMLSHAAIYVVAIVLVTLYTSSYVIVQRNLDYLDPFVHRLIAAIPDK